MSFRYYILELHPLSSNTNRVKMVRDSDGYVQYSSIFESRLSLCLRSLFHVSVKDMCLNEWFGWRRMCSRSPKKLFCDTGETQFSILCCNTFTQWKVQSAVAVQFVALCDYVPKQCFCNLIYDFFHSTKCDWTPCADPNSWWISTIFHIFIWKYSLPFLLLHQKSMTSDYWKYSNHQVKWRQI